MKKIFAVFILILATTLINAQKVEVSKDDKILVDGEEYAILKKTSSGLEHAQFSLQNLDGEEVAYAKVSTDVVPESPATASNNVQSYYIHITFAESGTQASMIYSLSFKKQFAKELVRCNAFADGKYNASCEKKFVSLNPFKGNQNQNTTTVNVNVNGGGGNGYQLVSRNRSGMILVIGDDIQQDNTTVGTFTEDSGFNGGKQVKNYSFSLPDGTQVAYATVEGINSKTATIVTNKDNRTHTVAITSNYNVAKEVAKYLISKFYL